MSLQELDTIKEMLAQRPNAGEAKTWQSRNAMDLAGLAMPMPEESIDIWKTSANGVPALAFEPADADPSRTLLYFHGGGYSIGSPLSHRHLVAKLAIDAGVNALSVDYRMAPEDPFPAAVDDAVVAYQYLLDQGTDPQKIVLSGDSAGGGLTIATLLALRDLDLPLPAAAAPISPWVDMTCSGESYQTRGDKDPMIQHEGIRAMASLYLDGQDDKTPLASPLHADLAGLPPLLIHVGDSEVLLSDSQVLAERARAAGVDVRINIYDDMIHVWHFFWPMLSEARDAVDEITAFMREKLN